MGLSDPILHSRESRDHEYDPERQEAKVQRLVLCVNERGVQRQAEWYGDPRARREKAAKAPMGLGFSVWGR